MLERDRLLLHIRTKIAAGAALWEDEARATDYLLQPGEPLREAEELMRDPGEELTSRVKAFIQASLIFLDSHPILKTRRRDQTPKDSLIRFIEFYEAWGKPDKAAQYRSMLPRDETSEEEGN